MNDLDMSRPGSELFPDQSQAQYNSYTDVNMGQAVDDPLSMGVKQNLDVASQAMSDKEYNFRALGSEVTKLKEEREYWKGQAEAYSRMPERAEPKPQDAYAGLDWDDGKDVQKAFVGLREQNESLRSELKDAITALTTKTQRHDWDNMVTQNIPQLTSKNPIFAEMIKNASNPYEAAYLLAEMNAKASQQQAPSQPQMMSSDAQRAIANAQKPQSSSSIGGRGQLSQADYYAQMSDEDFHKVASRNMANI